MGRLPPSVREDLQGLLRLVRSNGLAEARAAAVPQVARTLYAAWYCTSAIESASTPWPLGRGDLSAALRASTATWSRFEGPWVVTRVTLDGSCLIARGDQVREVRPGTYINIARPGVPVAPGEAVSVTACIDWVDPATGFWFQRAAAGAPSAPLVRLYWNVDWDRVGLVLHELTRTLDASGAPYLLKCPCWAGAYGRVDSLVVYLERSSWTGLQPEILATAGRTRDHLRASAPPLTLRLAHGVGFAEDPGSGANESYGESRCRALAPAVMNLLRKRPPSLADGVTRLADALMEAGIDPQHPWTNGATDAGH